MDESPAYGLSGTVGDASKECVSILSRMHVSVCFEIALLTNMSRPSVTKAANPNAKTWVYRNIVKALPWFTDVRIKLNDPRYSGWFLPVKGNAAVLYHDTRQTWPGNCGRVECGEYLWDHRNQSLRAFIVDTIVGGPDAMGNAAIDGLFLDVRLAIILLFTTLCCPPAELACFV
eukprot:SAG31_NODE_4584_length_3117_cov_1.583830_1_plen_174_part_00